MKKIITIILAVLVAYLIIGSFSFVGTPKQALPKLDVVRVDDENNSMVDIEKINLSLTEIETAAIDGYFENNVSSPELKTVISNHADQLVQFNKAIQKSGWFNNNLRDSGSINPKLRLPNLSNVRTLVRLSIIQSKLERDAKSISTDDYQMRIQRLYDFGQTVENGSYSFIEFLVGKSIKAIALGRANKDSIELSEKSFDPKVKQRLLLSEFTLVHNSLQQPKREIAEAVDEASIKYSWPVFVPFLFKAKSTEHDVVEMFFTSKNAINTNQCDSIPNNAFHWYDWLLPNSVGKHFTGELVVIPDTLCRE